MKKYWKRIAAFVAVAGIALTATACSSNPTVVTYKGGKITQDDYYKEMKDSQAGKTTLANMIIYRALEQQYGNKVSQKKVDSEYNNYKKQYGSQFTAALEQNGMTPTTFKQNVKTNLLTEAALRSIKKISKSEEEKAWKEYQPKITVEHILVSKKSDAEDIIKQLDNGANFGELAKKDSLDTATKNKDGKLPAFDSTDTTLDPDFKAAAFKLKKDGDYTKTPVKSQAGYHVIKLIKRPSKGSFAAHKKEIDNMIYQSMEQDQNVMRSVIQTVLKRADVSIKDKDLSNVLTQYMSSTPQPQQQPAQ